MFPKTGRPVDEVLRELEERKGRDVDWRGGKVFSLAYDAGDEIYDLAVEASSKYLSTNALNPMAFPQTLHMTLASYTATGFAVAGIHALEHRVGIAQLPRLERREPLRIPGDPFARRRSSRGRG